MLGFCLGVAAHNHRKTYICKSQWQSTVNADLCDVEKLFGKDCAFHEILKSCGASREISTSAEKQDVSPVESFVPLSSNVNKK